MLGSLPRTRPLRRMSNKRVGRHRCDADAVDTTPRITDEEILRRGDWPEFMNGPMTEAECEAIRPSIRRNRPCDNESRTRSTAARAGLLSSLRSRGDQGAVDPEIAQNP
jgi:hypothetical protein